MSIEEIRKRLSSMLGSLSREDEIELRLRILPPSVRVGGEAAAEGEPARTGASEGRSFEQSLGEVVDEVRRLRASGEGQADAMREIAGLLERSGGSSRVVETMSSRGGVGSRWALSPVVSGIARLFGGGSEASPPAPVVHALPPPIEVEAGVSRQSPGVLHEIARDQGGRPRIVASASPITVNVQAMDSRSFLDHSDEIARAVREAMLGAHGINDVVSEL